MSVRINVGFFHLLTMALVILKLVGAIKWSWAMVLLPSWGPIAFALTLLTIGAVIVRPYRR